MKKNRKAIMAIVFALAIVVALVYVVVFDKKGSTKDATSNETITETNTNAEAGNQSDDTEAEAGETEDIASQAEAPMALGDKIETDSGVWELVWSDEFEGNELDTTKWDYQYGTGSVYGLSGWGNEELEYYRAENVSVADGFLQLRAEKEDFEKSNYTSGRIRTLTWTESEDGGDKTLFSKKYGRFDARIKCPAGNGIWPAFWLLPDPNENPYGEWATSGEIDIMEIRGRLTHESSGTVHFGGEWPSNRNSGDVYKMPSGESIDQFHVYSLEWEPGALRWYVDNNLFYEEHNWYGRAKGSKEDFPYPAPFDEEFYILLNLALGGNFDGGIMPGDSVFPATMYVDYVRVYDKEGGYDENVTKPKLAVDEEASAKYVKEGDIDYSYIQDINFDTINEEKMVRGSMDTASSNWYFLALSDFGGSATLEKGEEDGYKYVSVDVTNKGNQNYSVQLIQHFPLVMGYTYELSFDAKATEERPVVTKFGGDGDNAWAVYAGEFQDKITTEWQHYTQNFPMMNASDPEARLEFNLGSSTGEVKIANVTVKIVSF